MNKIQVIRRLLSDNSGATAIEYGLIAALIAVASIIALTAVGTSVSGSFNAASQAFAPTGA